jgi:ribosome-binding factor A
MGQSHRTQKVADRIKVVVAQLLETKIKDPRLGFVTVTDARVTGDLQNASIFYTVLGDEEQRAATAAALESAKGVIRSAVGRDLQTRITPSNLLKPLIHYWIRSMFLMLKLPNFARTRHLLGEQIPTRFQKLLKINP